MTLALHDTEGYVGDLGSVNGLIQLREAFILYPLLNSFLTKGFSEQLDDLEIELDYAIQRVDDPVIRDGGEYLLSLIRVCENAAYITDE